MASFSIRVTPNTHGSAICKKGQALHCNLKVELPLSTDPLCNLVQHLRSTMAHNFFPAFLVLGFLARSGIALFPMPSVTSQAQERPPLFIVVLPSLPYTHPGSTQRQCLRSTQPPPLGIDDPKSRTVINDLTIALFNGAKGATIKRGEVKPSSMAVISANFSTAEQQK